MAAGLLWALAACQESSVPAANPTAPNTAAGAVRYDWVGPSLHTEEGQALVKLSRLVALALSDQGLRQRVKNDMRNAPFREHKLEFRSYIRGQSGGILLAKMAKVNNSTARDVLALVNQTRPLEFYMPVDAQRESWTGGADLVVLAILRDHEIPVGFTTAGEVYRFTSAEVAPAVPVFSLVPVETNFSLPLDTARFVNVDRVGGRAVGSWMRRGSTGGGQATPLQMCNPTDENDCGGGGGDPPPPPPPPPSAQTWYGLWIKDVYTGNDYEGFGYGDPEFEMHLQNASTTPRTSLICDEEDYSVEPYRFDMNSTDYIGKPFLLAQPSDMPDSASLVIAMYEDDDTRCVIKDDRDYIKLTTDAVAAAGDLYKGISKKQYLNGQFVSAFFKLGAALASILGGNDEFVGVATSVSNVGASPVEVMLKDENMIVTGRMKLVWERDSAWIDP